MEHASADDEHVDPRAREPLDVFDARAACDAARRDRFGLGACFDAAAAPSISRRMSRPDASIIARTFSAFA